MLPIKCLWGNVLTGYEVHIVWCNRLTDNDVLTAG